MTLHLISHALCPYVQRVAISLLEKGVAFQRTSIDLGNKPDWFLALSPLGKTPVLLVDGVPIFESSVILEYLEETQPNPLHPELPLERAGHRAWMEVGSAVLNDIAGLYSAPDAGAFAGKVAALRAKFVRIDRELGAGPYFAGERFCLVDTVFGPVFRYFDVLDQIADFGILTGLDHLQRWRAELAQRHSVRMAVTDDYPELLTNFLMARGSHLSAVMANRRE
ncbi:glutathione S-transferase family protein [Pannonibacter sp. SL95]|uniref:glutathione S-transferase family protein n=1 Tax=Pannonibacter sp. SL95 TaxID=2995153 RepID=UPI002272E256|nr:glutathione S-transferase family protein [Pannonibacter sp. SL95]MCY1707111.1 glutathione S-transferase family protein [Pannonibacter sp. SL95]